MINLSKPAKELQNGYKDKGRLELVAALPCIICQSLMVFQESRTEVHHFMGHGGGKKASDLKTIPLCDFHHSAKFEKGVMGLTIHKNLAKFEEKFGTQKELLDITNEMIFENYDLKGKQLEVYEIIKEFTNKILGEL